MDDKVREIISHEAQAEEAEASANEHRWEAARLISEELASGTSQRQLAREIGKDEKHVRLMRKCWESCGLKSAPEDRPLFNTVYNSTEVRGEPKAKTEDKTRSRPELEPEPEPALDPKPHRVPAITDKTTDKEEIARRFAAFGNWESEFFYNWLVSMGAASMSEDDSRIVLRVRKPAS
jgi:hypothetical protein